MKETVSIPQTQCFLSPLKGGKQETLGGFAETETEIGRKPKTLYELISEICETQEGNTLGNTGKQTCFHTPPETVKAETAIQLCSGGPGGAPTPIPGDRPPSDFLPFNQTKDWEDLLAADPFRQNHRTFAGLMERAMTGGYISRDNPTGGPGVAVRRPGATPQEVEAMEQEDHRAFRARDKEGMKALSQKMQSRWTSPKPKGQARR